MTEAKLAMLHGLLKDFGFPVSVGAAMASLWKIGWWQTMPAVIVLSVGIYTLWLHRHLPWHRTILDDLKQLNRGEFSHPALKMKVDSVLQSMGWNHNRVLRDSSSLNIEVSGRWLRSMQEAERTLDQWMGRRTWSFQSFNKVLLLAMCYPVLSMLLVWWWTGVGQFGTMSILGSLGSGPTGWILRSTLIAAILICTLLIWKSDWTKLIAMRIETRWWEQKSERGYIAVRLSSTLCLFAAINFNSPGILILLILAFTAMVAFSASTVGSRETVLSTGISIGLYLAVLVVATAVSELARFRFAATPLAAGLLGLVFGYTLFLYSFPSNRNRAFTNRPLTHPTLWLGACLCALTVIASTIPAWTSEHEQIKFLFLNSHIIWLFYLGWMPFVNALFDYISLGITRELLRKMTRSFAWMWGGVLLDLAAGVFLTLGLLWMTFQVIHFLQWCGWPVDAETIRYTFISDPFDPKVSWLPLFAVSNLLPTIWHVGMSIWGLADRQFITTASLKGSLLKLSNSMDENGNIKIGVLKPGLGELEIQAVYRNLYVHPWLYVGTVVAVVVGLWGSYVHALRWTLTWLPGPW